MVWSGSRHHLTEGFVKVSSRSNLFWLVYRRSRVGLVWIGMVWFDLRQHPSEASEKVSSISNLFWLFWRILLSPRLN